MKWLYLWWVYECIHTLEYRGGKYLMLLTLFLKENEIMQIELSIMQELIFVFFRNLFTVKY